MATSVPEPAPVGPQAATAGAGEENNEHDPAPKLNKVEVRTLMSPSRGVVSFGPMLTMQTVISLSIPLYIRSTSAQRHRYLVQMRLV